MQKMAERHGIVRGTVGDWQGTTREILPLLHTKA